MEREQEVEYIDAVGSDGDSIMASKGKVFLTTGKCANSNTNIAGGSLSPLQLLSLVILSVQNAGLIIVMRYVRTRPGPMFASSTAVVMSEIFKIGVCLVVIFVEQRCSLSSLFAHLNENIFKQPRDCLRISVPAFAYMIQNNLIYIAASNLNAATFQVTYQLKILTTAVLSVVMLRRHLSRLQWFSLLLLFIGVAIVNVEANSVSSKETNSVSSKYTKVKAVDVIVQSPLIGFLAVFSACVLSGFAGVYFEKILKSTPQSIYIRNTQLGFIGGVLGLGPVFIGDGTKVIKDGFFYGYDIAVWSVVLLHGFGGIVVAVVVKYADNILKGFAASAAIIIACVFSVYLFQFQISITFLSGASCVIISSYLYSRPVKSTLISLRGTPQPSVQESNESQNGLIKNNIVSLQLSHVGFNIRCLQGILTT